MQLHPPTILAIQVSQRPLKLPAVRFFIRFLYYPQKLMRITTVMAPGEERLMMQNPLTTSALIFRSPSKWNPNIQLVDLLERMRKCLENKDLRFVCKFSNFLHF